MKCPKCGLESAEGSAFCGECGYDFSSDSIMNALDDAAPESAKKSKKSKTKPKKEKAADPSDEKNNKALKLKITLIAAAALAAVVGIIIFVLSLSSTEGEKVLKTVPIGRDLAYAESKTEREFTLVSKYAALSSVADFDGVCESSGEIKIEGTRLPEWALTVSLAADNTINKVGYYDFSQLQKSWKGHHSNAEIQENIIEYGMNEKTVDRKMGFKPYAVIKKIDNTASKVYRYYYSDEVTGNDKVCNFVVVFDDASGTVKDVYIRKIDFCGLMLSFDQ